MFDTDTAFLVWLGGLVLAGATVGAAIVALLFWIF